MDQAVTGPSAKTGMEINEISARALGPFYRRVETTGILRWDEIKDKIQLEAFNISTELAINKEKEQRRPGRERHGPQRIPPSVGCVRKRRENNSTTPPTRHGSRNRSGRRKDGSHQEYIHPELRPMAGTPPIHQIKRRARRDPKGEIGKGLTNHVCQEKGRQTPALRRVSGAQRSYQEGSTPATAH